MFGGVEYELVPAKLVQGGVRPAKKQKSTKTWLAGELILRCERQGLTQLPQQLWYKATVRQLILSGNALTSIPSDIGALKELRLLKLDHNLLKQLPGELACLAHLETLELQHNQLQAVPAGLCTLVHLSLINLDGNPLSQRMASGGPKLLEVWDANNAQQQPQQHQQQQQQQQPAEGDSVEPAKPKQVTAGAVAARKAEAAEYRQLLQARTQALMGHLLNLQEPGVAMGVKQAKLAVLQEQTRQRVRKLLRVADLTSLEACAAITRHAGLSQDDLQAVAEAQAATEALKAATTAEDVESLNKALKHFEELCKPGRPSGPEYIAAHTAWRHLQREALQHGWRAAASPTGTSTAEAGEPTSSNSSSSAAAKGPVADIYAPIDRPEEGARGRRYMTWQERKKQDLIQSGAKQYETWLADKVQDISRKEQTWKATVAKEQHSKKDIVAERAANALRAAELEQRWPSGARQAYPPGTFAPSPQQLLHTRKAYTPQGLGSLYASMSSLNIGSAAANSSDST